ncbi:MAG TPA: hypothetical protein VEK08_26880 [Planctomycetota bacterium]|nr:hypothetical protein [Planctomycetota bacterium]
MSEPIDPADFKMPFGRKDDGAFKGMRLGEIAQKDGGLVWLKTISDWAAEKGIHGWMVDGVRKYLAQPKVKEVLELALAQDKDRRKNRAIARNREKSRQREIEDWNNDRKVEYGGGN